ncbi:Holliday junction ATP-dependent DNA helicase RuvA [Kordiimonas sediminis]|uniref:Holliday junction branch migration complex subunit RuvA n=1 Tax=Kordiimonas sediminis TaxID=1735581 RepID=A0A919ARI2_9PROT|nr:Holliday junction branch migration protein RuvA [Kordiimonas sediminis]GHF22452.1 Holliday junction ATP-dependent DNA helicase RuvA [Kordiimonas sediminis]
MIAKLKGLLDSVGDDWLIIDVGGVGYLVHASSRSLSQLPAAGEAISLFIETVVREDAITLFGFTSKEDQDLFLLLTSVQGVGAKVGLAIQSALSPDEIKTAIAAQDKTAVSRANGVGPKLAGRIVNELKDKVTAFVTKPQGVQMPSGAGAPVGAAPQGGVIEDAVSALVNLGYKPVEAHGAVARVLADLGADADVSKVIPAALKELSVL